MCDTVDKYKINNNGLKKRKNDKYALQTSDAQ